MKICTAALTRLLASEVASADEGPVVVDLSMDFETSNLDNPGADMVAAVAAATQDISSALVLEHGKIVANYVREGVDPNEPLPLWSVTKSWISLLVGLAIESGVLTLNETLGDIFTDEAVWTNVTEADFRKKRDHLRSFDHVVRPD
jgi:CubicO group peptidase (beta-lactamase class C family)